VCEPIETIKYDGASEADLKETADGVEALDRRVVALKADVRDYAALAAARRPRGRADRHQQRAVFLASDEAPLHHRSNAPADAGLLAK
jgi:hypothetical protein